MTEAVIYHIQPLRNTCTHKHIYIHDYIIHYIHVLGTRYSPTLSADNKQQQILALRSLPSEIIQQIQVQQPPQTTTNANNINLSNNPTQIIQPQFVQQQSTNSTGHIHHIQPLPQTQIQPLTINGISSVNGINTAAIITQQQPQTQPVNNNNNINGLAMLYQLDNDQMNNINDNAQSQSHISLENLF